MFIIGIISLLFQEHLDVSVVDEAILGEIQTIVDISQVEIKSSMKLLLKLEKLRM